MMKTNSKLNKKVNNPNTTLKEKLVNESFHPWFSASILFITLLSFVYYYTLYYPAKNFLHKRK